MKLCLLLPAIYASSTIFPRRNLVSLAQSQARRKSSTDHDQFIIIFTMQTTNGFNDTNISETCKVFTFELLFAGFSYEGISKIMQNQFSLLNLYKLLHIMNSDIMYWNQIIIEYGTLQICRLSKFYQHRSKYQWH